MRLRALCTTIVGLALAGSTLAVVAATPANAATVVPTRIVSGTSGKPVIYDSSYRNQPGATVYGDSLSLSINVQAYVGGAWTQIYDGSLSVVRKMGSTSAVVASTSGEAYLYGSTKAAATATYVINYAGGSGYASGSPVTFAPTSLSGALQVQRKLVVTGTSGRKVTMTVAVGPVFRGKVYIFKKSGKAWKRYKVLRTNVHSKIRTTLPVPRHGKYYWRVRVASGAGFVLTQSGTYFTHRV